MNLGGSGLRVSPFSGPASNSTRNHNSSGHSPTFDIPDEYSPCDDQKARLSSSFHSAPSSLPLNSATTVSLPPSSSTDPPNSSCNRSCTSNMQDYHTTRQQHLAGCTSMTSTNGNVVLPSATSHDFSNTLNNNSTHQTATAGAGGFGDFDQAPAQLVYRSGGDYFGRQSQQLVEQELHILAGGPGQHPNSQHNNSHHNKVGVVLDSQTTRSSTEMMSAGAAAAAETSTSSATLSAEQMDFLERFDMLRQEVEHRQQIFMQKEEELQKAAKAYEQKFEVARRQILGASGAVTTKRGSVPAKSRASITASEGLGKIAEGDEEEEEEDDGGFLQGSTLATTQAQPAMGATQDEQQVLEKLRAAVQQCDEVQKENRELLTENLNVLKSIQRYVMNR